MFRSEKKLGVRRLFSDFWDLQEKEGVGRKNSGTKKSRQYYSVENVFKCSQSVKMQLLIYDFGENKPGSIKLFPYLIIQVCYMCSEK